MTESDSTRCPSCGILSVNHPGLIPTCRELMEARAEAKILLEENISRKLFANALETVRDEAIAELMRMTKSFQFQHTRAEAAETEVEQLQSELSVIRYFRITADDTKNIETERDNLIVWCENLSVNNDSLTFEVERLREEVRSWKMVTTDTNSVVMLRRCEQLQAEVGRLEEIEQYWRNETAQALERAEAAEADSIRYKKIVDALYAQPCNGYANCWHCIAREALEVKS